MNYMEQITQILGVELGEEFYIKDIGCKCKLTNDGMFSCYKDNWNKTRCDLSDILTGKLEIIKKTILDEAEKEYLSNVIKPFRDRVKAIAKYSKGSSEFIVIRYSNTLDGFILSMNFPIFGEGEMYKGMKLGKEYTLEDLGL